MDDMEYFEPYPDESDDAANDQTDPCDHLVLLGADPLNIWMIRYTPKIPRMMMIPMGMI
jgi:hypothetical protein